MLEVRDRLNFEDYLDSLLNSVESDDLEFKSAAGGFPGSFWDTYSAFANSEGGVIVLGVIERKGKFYIDNLSDEQIEKYTKDFWNKVNNRATVSCNLLKTEDVVVEDYNGHKLMLFFIPRASREQRPVYRTSQPYNGTFKRNYEGDYKCTEKEVQRMFADADVSRPADSRILKNYSMIDGYVTNESLRVVLDIHKAEIADLLKDMCQDGLLVQDGYGRGTKYYLPNDGSNITSNIASSDSNITCSGSNIPSNIASSGSKVASLSPNIPSSDSNIPSNIASSGSKVANLSSNIPSPNISISNMESLRKKKKLSFEELKKLICLVCSDWQSLDELALQVNRNKTYLKIYVIPRMLADKSLEMMFPGVPKHPRQKYKSTVKK